jgi:hypothetical protein
VPFILYVVFPLLLLFPQIWRRNETSEADHKGFWYGLKLLCTLSTSSFLEVNSPNYRRITVGDHLLLESLWGWGMVMKNCALQIVTSTKSIQVYNIILPSPVPNLLVIILQFLYITCISICPGYAPPKNDFLFEKVFISLCYKLKLIFLEFILVVWLFLTSTYSSSSKTLCRGFSILFSVSTVCLLNLNNYFLLLSFHHLPRLYFFHRK